ncbi:CesT family type III secretion system chaperone [Thalassospira sp. MA62]|nr:CesT family type III secretion system chaperone [Thalassospira sp. MA62]
MSEKELASLVSELARSLRIDTPSKRRDGSYRLRFDGQYTVTLSLLPGGQIVIAGRLKRLPHDEDTRKVVLRDCMQFALGRAADSQSTLSIDKKTDALFLHRAIDGQTLPREFEEILGDFVNDLFWWKDNLADPAPASGISRKATPAPSTPPQFFQPNLLVR